VNDDRAIHVESLGRAPYTFDLRDSMTYDDARELFHSDPANHWASYVIGVFLALSRERGVRFSRGARVVIASAVPEGKGVSSSAALEAAVMQAVCGAFRIQLEPREMALLCQKAENLVAGAPCGVMDQMTCICGAADSLLALLCQPAELQAPVPLPEELALWGIDSGERHAVGGSDYTAVRTGAFMGRRIMQCSGYLANIAPSEFEKEYAAQLPEEMYGADFLALYSDTGDDVTRVERDRMYKIRRPTEHPVYENHRVQTFRQLLPAASSEAQHTLLGDLMYQSHESYAACGLGSRGTDLIVNFVRAEGTSNGLYGARITGGGSGGTVAVLGRRDAAPAIQRIIEAYAARIGYRPYVFSGSSDGSARSGSQTVSV
jgi:L-arabinokinase